MPFYLFLKSPDSRQHYKIKPAQEDSAASLEDSAASLEGFELCGKTVKLHRI